MADTNEFIRNMIQMWTVRNQMEDAARRFEIEDRNSAFAALGSLTNTLRSTRNPEAQGPLVESFIRQYLPDMPQDAFHAFIGGLQPTEEATRVGEAREGLAAMGPSERSRTQGQAASVGTTGMDLGQSEVSSFLRNNLGSLLEPQNEGDRAIGGMFRDAQLARIFAGQTPEQFTLGQATRGLLTDDEGARQSAARISLNLEPGAEALLGAATARRGQDLTYAIGRMGNQVQMAQIEQQGAIATLQAGIQLEQMRMESEAGQGLTPAQLIDLQQYQSGLVEMLRRGGMAPWMKQQVATQLDNANAILAQQGLQAPNLDPSAIAGGPRLNNPNLFPMYPSPQQQQQQLQGAQQFMPQPFFPRP